MCLTVFYFLKCIDGGGITEDDDFDFQHEKQKDILLLCHAKENNGRSNISHDQDTYDLYNIEEESNITYMDYSVVDNDKITIKNDFTKKNNNTNLKNEFDFILSINCDMTDSLLQTEEKIKNVIYNILYLLKKW